MVARTEREIVLETTGLWFRHSEWSVEKFAHERLAPALVAAGLLEPEVIASATGDEYLRCRKAWGQRLNRIFNGSAPSPLNGNRSGSTAFPRPKRDSRSKRAST